MFATRNIGNLLCVAALASLVSTVVAAPAGAGHGAVSYETRMAEKARREKAAAATAAPVEPPIESRPAAKPGANLDQSFAAELRRNLDTDIRNAQRQIDSGNDSKLKELATRVVETRRKEIADLDRWLSESPTAD